MWLTSFRVTGSVMPVRVAQCTPDERLSKSVIFKGTAYENAVNPRFAEDADAHFDILSFDLNGEHIYIEVKSTTGKASNNFNLTIREYEKAKECLANGERYEIHRVHHIYNPKKCGRVIITAEELFEKYNFKIDSFLVKRKVS